MNEINDPAQPAPAQAEARETDDHLAHLPSVDPEWARQFIEYDQKFQHFYTATGFFFVTPRVVKIAILKPQAIIGLLRKQHDEYLETNPTGSPFEESISMDWEAWSKPVATSLPIWDLERGLKCYREGMTPMEALQDIHADSEDGDENSPVSSGTLLIEPVMVMAVFAILIIGLITFFTSAREARDHAADIEATKKVEATMSATHH